jgi:HlyD family secretion protein
MAAFRVLPLARKVFSSASVVKSNIHAFEKIRGDLEDALRSWERRGSADEKNADSAEIAFDREIRMEKVSFAYPASDGRTALKEADITIARNRVVGFVGPSGSGKTTAADIMMGLLKPDSGRVVADGVEIDDSNRGAWGRMVGYAPQSIFLFDASIAENIAFGDFPPDMGKVEKAAALAGLDGFVESLPEGYRTGIGERGAKLSGGQRQRIGIARALYRDPPLVILDEPTSSLDGITEAAVIDAVRRLGREKTVVIVAHRAAAIRECDELFLFEDGAVVARGAYEELISKSASFRAMAGENGED